MPAWVHGGASVCKVHMPKERRWRLSVWYSDIRAMTTQPWKSSQTPKRVSLTGSCKCIAVRGQTKRSSPNSSTTRTSIGGILINLRVANRPPQKRPVATLSLQRYGPTYHTVYSELCSTSLSLSQDERRAHLILV